MTASPRAPRLVFLLASLGLLAAEALRVYWIMPLPGSQQGGTLALAYALHRAIWPLRLVLGPALLWSSSRLLAGSRWLGRSGVLLAIAVVALVAWQANGPMSADTMFRQPRSLRFADAASATLSPGALVLGVALPVKGGAVEARESPTGAVQARESPHDAVEARAYPIRFLGYHHQVRDVVAGQEVMVTYCTVCRSGRVFRPLVDGAPDEFRLVGMDQWNAMFEDSRTGSWWRQATGESVAGPLAGKRLEEVESLQATWATWKALHPGTTVMEPDPAFAAEYADLEGFEEGTRPGKLTGRDPSSWGEKSWVVGVAVADSARAFDWNELAARRAIVDRIGDLPVLVTLADDGATFRAFDARHPESGAPLALEIAAEAGVVVDGATGTQWSFEGVALDGPDAGTRLAPLRASQEFWHSWRTFHPRTTARR